MQSKANADITHEGKYLTFQLGEEQYGISIQSVIEIIGMMEITALPQAPEFILGVTNLRGTVIPVVDLRCKFMMPQAQQTERSCIIVLETSAMSGTNRKVGIVVDAVSEVLYIKESHIEAPPSLGNQIVSQAILGIAKEKSGVKILIDLDKALGGYQDEIIAKAA